MKKVKLKTFRKKSSGPRNKTEVLDLLDQKHDP